MLWLSCCESAEGADCAHYRQGEATLESGDEKRAVWMDRHSPFDYTNPRGIAEDELLSLSPDTFVLELSGLWVRLYSLTHSFLLSPANRVKLLPGRCEGHQKLDSIRSIFQRSFSGTNFCPSHSRIGRRTCYSRRSPLPTFSVFPPF